MKVQFDLRPSVLLERERKQRSFNPLRIIALLLIGLFLASSVGYIVLGTINRFRLQEEVIAKEDEVASFEAEKLVLQRQVTNLQAQEKVFADTLKIMQEDLPSLEVLDALQGNMDEFGIGMKTLKFTIGRVTSNAKEPDLVEVTGTASSDRQINDFCERLRGSGVFQNVPGPGTTLDSVTGTISFTLTMPVLTMDRIQAARQEV